MDSTSTYTTSVSGKHHFTYVITSFSCKIIAMNDSPSAEGTQKAALNSIEEMILLLKERKHTIAKQMLEQNPENTPRKSGLVTRAKSSLGLNKAYQRSVNFKETSGMDSAAVGFLKKMIAHLTPTISNQEGIYRESVEGTLVDSFLKKYKELKSSDGLKDSSINEIFNELNIPEKVRPGLCANALKAILRQEGCLISSSQYCKYLEKVDLKNEDDVINSMRDLFSDLFPEHKELLTVLLIHLRQIAEASKTNKMDAYNLGIVFAPVLLDQKQISDPLSLIEINQKFALILQCCILKTDLFQKTHWLEGSLMNSSIRE